ncbi:hypothetical protein NPIL_241471 [Nephila pilipes]|uniref:Uncharacterized protein n=1 Tax=Nephila pilipes TaxID=299642 RepID=A0A8X6NND1_NEPPI|nr:hypothetical protein NPIL_241471 [Nephila pilipes]
MMEKFPIFSCLTSAFSEMHRSTSMTARGPVRTFEPSHCMEKEAQGAEKYSKESVTRNKNSNWTNAPNVTREETSGHSYIPNLFYFF